MGQAVGDGNQVHVQVAGHVGLPMAGDVRVEHESKKDVCDGRGNGNRPKDATIPAFRVFWISARRQGQLKGILRGAGSDANHAGAALGGADLNELIDGQTGRTDFGAFAAVDAGLCVTANFGRAEQ